MLRFKNSLRRLVTATMAAALALSMTATAFAAEPYRTYTYDTWEDAIPSQSAYRVGKAVSGADMGLSRLSDPNDSLFVGEDASDSLADASDLFVDDEREEFWVADRGNNRILRLNSDLEVIGCYTGVMDGENETSFKEPQGLYVKTSILDGKHYIYIADTGNSRIVKAEVKSDRELDMVVEYLQPESELYSVKTFNPSKVIADAAENVYAVCKEVNTGAVQFDINGEFKGYYGANRVEATAAVIAQKLWRKIASNEQIQGMTRSVPVEYANFDIDEDGFIYTVTEANTSTDAVKKVNPAGYNIWDNEVGDEYTFGDFESAYDATATQSFATKLTDIAVGDNGLINVLDYTTGRVFQYDRMCNLLCIFGTKSSNSSQRGSFVSPNAVDTLGNNVYVIDGTKDNITVFTLTAFGQDLHSADELYVQGKYDEAEPMWENVIKRDGGYSLAYIGMGKAALKAERYNDALYYFKMAYDRDDYDKAFEYAREDYLRNNFGSMMVIIVVLIAWLVIVKILHKKGIKIFRTIFGRFKKKEGK
ncbi:MAG: hypothetical protein ACI4I6_00480 [Hominimerdicola sp.]